MKFEQAFSDFKKGACIRRKSWKKQKTIHISELVTLGPEDYKSDDWEVVNLKFHDALNALINGRSIRRLSLGNSPSKSICIRNEQLYIGLGTCGASEYKFSEEDICSQDWIIED